MKDFRDIQENIVSTVSKELNNRLEILVENGLKLKGFSFESKKDLYSFVKDNCRLEQDNDLHQVFYVNEEKFLYIDNKPYFDYSDTYNTKVTYGEFKYL